MIKIWAKHNISRSFVGKHFRVTGKSIRHFITAHNDINFNSKRSEDMATKITEKSPVLTTSPLSFEAPRNGTSTNIRIALYHLKVVPGLHFTADSVGLSSFQISVVSSERCTICAADRVCYRRSRSSKVVDFSSNRKRLWEFLLAISFISHSRTVFEIRRLIG